uniref:Ultrahigh sulfur keratin-associated protein n=1 Tax=Strongyloides venezuelensis TaxID=75913 RepID=A0A0K0FK99_STRVS
MLGGCWGAAYSGCSGNSCGNAMMSPCQSRQCMAFFSSPAYQCRPGCTTPACCRSVVPNPCVNCAQPQSSMTQMVQMPQMNIQIKSPPRCCPCCMPVCSKMCVMSGGCNSCYDYYSDMGYGKK